MLRGRQPHVAATLRNAHQPYAGGMPRTFGSWLSGSPLPESGSPAEGPNDYPGQRLGLPEHGSGSLVGSGRRILALVVDWFISLGLAGFLITFGVVTSDQFRFSWQGTTATLAVWLVLGAISVRLFTFTPGQLALGLCVASVDHRMHVGFGRALARGLLIVPVVTVLFADSDGRGFQDKLTGTAVVRR
jgi:hypothetical protein